MVFCVWLWNFEPMGGGNTATKCSPRGEWGYPRLYQNADVNADENQTKTGGQLSNRLMLAVKARRQNFTA